MELVKIGKRNQTCLRMRNHLMPMADVFSFAVGDDGAGQRHFDLRMMHKKIVDGLERVGQILLVAIQVGEDVAGGAPVTAVHSVIHAAVLFDERLDARVARQPVLRAIIRAGILHDVFPFDALLVGDRRDAQFQPA